MPVSRSDQRAELLIPGTLAARFLAGPQSAGSTRSHPRRRVSRFALWVTCAFGALLLWPVGALAWKPVDHLYAANQAIAPILANNTGHNYVVSLLGKDYPVPDQVGKSIHDYPGDYRGGVVGPDAFPDIVGGQGNIHPDTRTDNDTRPHVNWTPGHSYAYEWLALVYRAGWDAYKRCNGCAEGQRDLAFTYGFLTHAGEDMWGHTFVNHFARGVFPSISELGDAAKRNIALRHIVTEGYVGVHTPATVLAIDAPTGFIYNTFIANPAAAGLGRGLVIDEFFKLRATLAAKVADFTDYIDHGTFRGCFWAVNWPACAARDYLNEWIGDIDRGLRAYPELSLHIARDLFGQPKANLDALGKDISDYVNAHLISMAGFPKLVGKLRELSTTIRRWISTVAEPIIAPIKDLEAQFLNKIVELVTGSTYDQWKDYVTSPATWINNRAVLGFASDTSKQLNTLMGLNPDAKPDAPCTTISGPSCFDPSKFAAIKDTINMARLILLNGAGLTSVLKAHNAAPYYLSDVAGYPQNIMVPVVAESSSVAVKMTGWIKSLDGDHQWMATSSRDGKSYGTGGMYLWQDCNARPVFRALFTDWEHSTNFPDSADARLCVRTVPHPPANVTRPAIAPFGAPQVCHAGVCGPVKLVLSPGTWTGGETVWYSYAWYSERPGCPSSGFLPPVCLVASSPEYTPTQADSGRRLYGSVTATNEFGESATALTVHGVPPLELTAPVISNLKVLQRSNLADATLTLSKPAELTVTLSRPMGTVPCTKFFKDRPGECPDWKPLEARLHVSATAGANAVSLRPFGALAPGPVQVTFEPKDSLGNIGAYDSTQFTVPMRCLGRRNCG